MIAGQQPCTKEHPDKTLRWHPDAVEDGDQEDGWPSGDIQRYICPHCGLHFKVELPQ